MYSSKLVVLRQNWLYLGKVVVIGQKWLYSGRFGCTQAKVFGILGKVDLLGQGGIIRSEVVAFGQNGLYSDKVVVY